MFTKLGMRKDGFQRMRCLAETVDGNRLSVSEKLDYTGTRGRYNFDFFYNNTPIRPCKQVFRKYFKEYTAITNLIVAANDCKDFKPFVIEA
jgi:hypothetical protein